MDQDTHFMKLALAEAEAAGRRGEVPVGALLVLNGEIIATGSNRREASFDPTDHAEVIALREGTRRIRNWRLTGATLYVTKEPCPMCAGTMVNARLSRLVFGCSDMKGGAVTSLYQLLSDKRLNHQVEVVHGLLAEESAALLSEFFSARRAEGRGQLKQEGPCSGCCD